MFRFLTSVSLSLLLLSSTQFAWARARLECEAAVTKKSQKWLVASALGLHPSKQEYFTITRVEQPDGFHYFDAKGKEITDEAELKRFSDLKIRKDLTDVHISTDPMSHLQAFGVAGNKDIISKYHPLWEQARDQVKFERMNDFGRALPAVRAKAAADLNQKGLPKTKLLAAIVLLLDRTHVRIGNKYSAEENETHGLTTMLKSDTHVSGQQIHFTFVGKSSKDQDILFDNADIAALIDDLRKLPGDFMFQYLNENGKAMEIQAQDVNGYLAEITGRDFTAKEFRTWGGTVAAATYLLSIERPATATKMKAELGNAAEASATALGNTRAISRKSYVHPAVFSTYPNALAWDAAFANRRRLPGLTATETGVLNLLKPAK